MDPWQIENLLRAAFARTKERFLSYLLSLGLSAAIGCGGILALLVLGVPVALLVSVTKFSAVAIFICVLLAISGLIALSYLGAWTSLTVVQTLIRDEKNGLIETFREVRPYVWGFVWYHALSCLFFLGLLPWGLLTLFIVPILWAIWGSFGAFVYLQKRKSGLENLWVSKALVSQRFWGIVGREALVLLTIMVIGALVSSQPVLATIWGLAQIFTTPFLICFSFEMYRLLPEPPPEKTKTPSGWVVVSALGWVLAIGLIILLVSLPSMLKLDELFLKEFNPVLPKQSNVENLYPSLRQPPSIFNRQAY